MMGAGMGLTMGAGLGQMVPSLLNQSLQAAAGADSQKSDDTASQTDPIERLGKLKKMLDAGLISEDEFAAKKNEILKGL